jgi:GNAT superfamily N-acetyltransferase
MMIFAAEPYAAWYREALPMFERHYQELGRTDALDPDHRLAMRLEQEGRLVCITARVDARLVGYALYILAPMAHYKTTTMADLDLLWLAPEWRRGRNGLRLIKFAEPVLAARGAQVVRLRAKLDTTLASLAGLMGYTEAERVYERRVG